MKLLCRDRGVISPDQYLVPQKRHFGAMGEAGTREIRNNQPKIKFPVKATRRTFVHTNVSPRLPKINSPSLFTHLLLCPLHLHVYRCYTDPAQLYYCWNKPPYYTNDTSAPISRQTELRRT